MQGEVSAPPLYMPHHDRRHTTHSCAHTGLVMVGAGKALGKKSIRRMPRPYVSIQRLYSEKWGFSATGFAQIAQVHIIIVQSF